jgi:hypothetical protein
LARLVAGLIAIVRAAACGRLSPRFRRRHRRTSDPKSLERMLILDTHPEEHAMSTSATRCDRIIALIDACLAEFGSPAEPTTPALVTVNDRSLKRHRR